MVASYSTEYVELITNLLPAAQAQRCQIEKGWHIRRSSVTAVPLSTDCSYNSQLIQLTIDLIQLEIQLTIELIQLDIQLIQLTMAGHSADYRVDLAGHLADLARQARQRELVALIFRLSGVPEPPGQSARLDAVPHPCTPSRDQPTGSVVTQPYMAYP